MLRLRSTGDACMTEVAEPMVKMDEITPEQLKRFHDVRFWLANLYKFSLTDRKHMKTKPKTTIFTEATLKRLNEERHTKPPLHWSSAVTECHTWFTVYMIRFSEMGWEGIDLSTSPPPKISDVVLHDLIRHQIFECDIKEIVDDKTYQLTSKQRKVLKEFALRIVP